MHIKGAHLVHSIYMVSPYDRSNFRHTMYDNSYMICRDCGSDSLVENWRDGDVVCKKCGLVSHCIVDDRPLFDENRSMDYCSSQFSNNTKDIEVSDALDRLRIDSKPAEMIAADIIDNYKTNKSYKGSWAALRAFATIEALSIVGFINVTKEEVCFMFDVDPKILKSFEEKENATTKSKVNKSKINQRLAGCASLLIQDEHLRKQALKRASVIEEKLLKDPRYLSKKPCKMDAVILYHICVEELNAKNMVSKDEFIKDCNVSIVTFSNHLKLLKKIVVGF